MKTEVSEIVQLIIEYTRQVEKYENVSTYYSAICLGGIWVTTLFYYLSFGATAERVYTRDI